MYFSHILLKKIKNINYIQWKKNVSDVKLVLHLIMDFLKYRIILDIQQCLFYV